VTRVSVLYPRGTRSGGPEALHQLVDALRSAGVSAHLVADRRSRRRDRVPDYDRYDAPETDRLVDEPGEVVIAPETYLPQLLRLRHARVHCWWLSIDNATWFRAERYTAAVRAGLADPVRLREVRAYGYLLQRTVTPWRRQAARIGHLTQSHYAREFLHQRLGVRSEMLGDYLPGADTALVPSHHTDAGSGPTVAFNRNKGARLAARVRAELGAEVAWAPLSGLPPDAVRERLRQASVYLDLGPHPGKDRMPREAALEGCVTLVARRGSGAHDLDVPLPAEHKISAGADIVAAAVAAVRDVVADPRAAYAAQEGYRAGIRAERAQFVAQVERLASSLRAPAAGGDR
jgi:hypothetical protein